MRKMFLISAFACFVIAMIISTRLQLDAFNNDSSINRNKLSEDTNIVEVVEIKSDKLSLNESGVEKADNSTQSPKTGENESENSEIAIQEVETKVVKANLETDKDNILINFNKDAQDVVFAGNFKLTAYCPCESCCDEYAENRPIDKNGQVIVETATGTNAQENHTIAVDPKVIPYGTTVIIERDGVFYKYVAEDCGGAIKNKRIDIFFNSHITACEFGIGYGKVYLIQE